MTTKKTVTFCMAALLVAAVQMTASGSGTIPGTNIQYDHILTASDSGSYYSLTAGSAYQNWSDGFKIEDGNAATVLYVPEGTGARTDSSAGTTAVVPIIYSAGRISPSAAGRKVTTFNDLRLLNGGYIDCKKIGHKAGKITILADDPDNPARLDWGMDLDYDYRYSCVLKAILVGSAGSQILFRSTNGAKVLVFPSAGSDWSGFHGTFRVEGDGLGIKNDDTVPISMPGTMRLANGGMLQLVNDNAPYSFGNLSFEGCGTITNTGSGATLTVSGTFDTGTNMTWYSSNPGTFGTLVLGDGLTLTDRQATPTTVLTVTNRLEVGENVTFDFPKAGPASKVLVLKLSPEAVVAGVPDFSDVGVLFAGEPAFWSSEPDPDVAGGLLVYALMDIVYYNGPDEWDDKNYQGKWLDPDFAPAYWSDGLYPNDPAKIYCVTQVVTTTESSSTFPGGTLIARDDIYMYADFHVEDLRMAKGVIYLRSGGKHLTGRVMASGGTRVMRALADRTFYVDAAIHGISGFEFECYYPAGSGGATFYLTADNSGWTGNLRTVWTTRDSAPVSADETTNHVRIVVGDAKALGGDQESFSYNKIALTDYAELWFTNTTVMTAANRGVYIVSGILRVDEGKSVNLMAPVSVQGTLYKVGTGTLGFGGGVLWRKTTGRTILVKEGAIKAASLAGGAVTFADNTGIVADESIGVMDLSGATVTAEGAIYLKADANTVPEPTEEVVYPVVKVSAEQDATLGPAFRAARAWKGWAATLVSDTDGDGNVTYSVKYEKKGTVIVIQ